jgi:predicted enzyme related to lactoylglutathione lyase
MTGTDLPDVSTTDSLPPLRGIHDLKFAVSDLDDPLGVAVDDRAALKRWDATLTERGVLHSPILDAVGGWLIVIQDPDGNRIRLYTLESHGPEVKPGINSPWLAG